MRTVLLALLCCSATLPAQDPNTTSGYDRSARATVIAPLTVYVAPDTQSQKITSMLPGREMIVEQRSGDWIKIFANTDEQEQREEETPEFVDNEGAAPKSGWIHARGVVDITTPQGDRILFGTAANAERQASEPHAPRDAAAIAYLLYRRMSEYFPDSSLADEAAWRSADIRWQIERSDIRSLPSAKEMEPDARPQLYDTALKRIVKQRGNTKYAALAAYDLLDSKMCGDWQGLPKCPQLESNLYEKYAAQYPDGPKTAEALWNAAYRQGVLVSMYTTDDDQKRANVAGKHASDLASQLQQKFPASDYAMRAAALVYKIQQSIPIYGNDRD